jgi:hypothetical protein
MNQLTLTFKETRARRNDCDTSHAATKAAVSHKADLERAAIAAAVKAAPGGLTGREVSQQTGIEYVECQRRMSECGLVKTDRRRDGCAVWEGARA